MNDWIYTPTTQTWVFWKQLRYGRGQGATRHREACVANGSSRMPQPEAYDGSFMHASQMTQCLSWRRKQPGAVFVSKNANNTHSSTRSARLALRRRLQRSLWAHRYVYAIWGMRGETNLATHASRYLVTPLETVRCMCAALTVWRRQIGFYIPL